MRKRQTLDKYLSNWAEDKPSKNIVTQTILQIALGSIQLAKLLRQGELATDDTAIKTKDDGDIQISMDVVADDIFYQALQKAPVAVIASEETDKVRRLNRISPLAVAIDPLDGSSNVNIDMSIGTIFTLLPYQDSGDPELSFMQRGRHQLAAGFTLYGPQTLLIISVCSGTQVFILDEKTDRFYLYQENLQVSKFSAEYAVNGSNQRHWASSTKEFVEECILGTEGSFKTNFNTRWTASMVADAYRILSRGGIYLYPGDKRKGYEQGRLRLVYEANPIALLMEQAGGCASNGYQRILDIEPETVHQRIPLVFGSEQLVKTIEDYNFQHQHPETHSPLFNTRGLFQ